MRTRTARFIPLVAAAGVALVVVTGLVVVCIEHSLRQQRPHSRVCTHKIDLSWSVFMGIVINATERVIARK
jgi:hypothetical protein